MATLSGGRGWLSDAAAASLSRMDAAYGGRLPITSAGRTYAQQAEAYRKYLNGTGSLALPPGTSVHESGNAVDFGSSAWGWLGSGRGLGWNGARANAYGWRRTVSSESWHYEYDRNRDQYIGSGAGFSQDTKNRQAWLNQSRGAGLVVDGIAGPATVQAIKNYQTFLRGYGYSGAIDGDWGAGTQAAHQKYYDAYHASAANPATDWNRAIQEKLNKLGYGLTVDGIAGTATQAAVRDFQSKNGLEVDGIAGPATNNKLDAVISGLGTGSLVVDGEWGAATTRKLQEAVSVPADGEIGPITIKALQARLGVAQDGEIGPATITALQRVIGSTPDGQLGPNTIKALQTYLNSGGRFDTSSNPAPSNPATLEVDGQWGAATTKALQTKLGVSPVDGELGPITWKAFQTAVGITADGEPGPQTYKALQTLVGAVVDGQLGPETIKKLQEFLNSNGEFRKVEIPADVEPVKYPKPANPTYPDADWWDHSSNSSPRRTGDKVQYFVIHHAADPRDLTQQRDRFMNPNDRKVSPNWLIGKDGSVSEIVPPDNFRAWTTGQFDYNAVTVETQNTSGAPDWGISEESHVTIAKLVAWASKRYGFAINRKQVIGHREVPGQATACPGPSMDLEKIVQLAQEFAAEEPAPDPETPEEPTPTPDPETPAEEEWTITLPKDEAVELGKLLDAVRKLLP